MSWQKTKISEFLTERTDRFKPDKANELGLPRIEKIDFSGTIYINNFKPTKTGMILVKDGDLVISGINVEKGALAIYKGETDVLATIHYSSYTYDENKIDIEYLKWYLQSNIFRNILKEQVKSGIKTEIKPKTFLNLEIMLPDLTTQKQIASKLNKLDWNVKDLDFTCFCNNELIYKLRQSILQDAIQGKLVPQDPTDEPASELLKKIKEEKEQTKMRIKYSCDYVEPLFHIPDSWTWCKFSNIIEHMEYGTSNKASEIRIGIPILRMNNIQNGRLDYSKLKYISSDTKDLPRLYLKKYDILFNRTNSYELVGKTALYEGNNDEYTFASYLIRVCLFKNYINPKYVTYYLNSQLFRKLQIEPLIIQQCGQANYSGDKLKNVLIPIPPKEEQARIVEKVDELMQLCDKLENENSNAQKFSSELLQTIMQKYFTPEV